MEGGTSVCKVSKRTKKGRRVPMEAVLAGPGQEVGQAGRELGSGDPAGVSSGAWGAQVSACG